MYVMYYPWPLFIKYILNIPIIVALEYCSIFKKTHLYTEIAFSSMYILCTIYFIYMLEIYISI